jgi:GTP diphosphokinase / guanosine-3',5'-bis(diphosphate) 3'-diphosphatase
MLLSVAEDARVIRVKVAERGHNVRTLEHLPKQKHRRITPEPRKMYGPLVLLLRIAAVRREPEDFAVKFLEPEGYEALTKKIKQRQKERP